MDDHCGLDVKLLERFLKRHFYDVKPIDVISVQVKPAVAKGDNYLSAVYRVKTRFLLASGKHKTFSTIVKTELPSEDARDSLSAFSVFRAEIKTYVTILSMMEDLSEEFEDKREKLWANIYGFKPYSLVAFEDLTDRNYFGANRRNSLGLNHSLLVLRSLGRYHAMSKVLLDRGLITQDDEGKLVFKSEEEVIVKWWYTVFTMLTRNMTENWGPEWKAISEKLVQHRSDVNRKFAKLSENYDKRFDVLNHGDLWTCNMLFQYLEFEEIPISVKFVDFQACHTNSFIWDIEYFLNTSTIPSVRRANKPLLHKAYHESLESNLKFFKYEGYIPTFEDVQNESQRIEFAQMGFLTFQPILTAETSNAMDFANVTKLPPEKVIHESVYSDGKALERLGEDFKYFFTNGIMDFEK